MKDQMFSMCILSVLSSRIHIPLFTICPKLNTFIRQYKVWSNNNIHNQHLSMSSPHPSIWCVGIIRDIFSLFSNIYHWYLNHHHNRINHNNVSSRPIRSTFCGLSPTRQRGLQLVPICVSWPFTHAATVPLVSFRIVNIKP